MTSLGIGITCVTIAGLAWAFTVLQLVTLRQWRGLAWLVGILILGGAVVATRADGIGVAWLRNATWRGDAIALGAIVPLVSLVAGIFGAGINARGWALGASLPAAFATVLAGFAAFWIDRGAWHWDSAAIVIAGLVIASLAGTVLFARQASPNRRLVFGCASFAGCFVAFAGFALSVASGTLV